MAGTTVVAAPPRLSPTDLGRPTDAVAQYFPLGGFHRRGPVLASNHRPELLFIGTQPDEFSAAERWPLVKALDQFGTFTGVKPETARYCILDNKSTVVCVPPYPYWRDYPTFDLTHARYTSRYLVFAHIDLLDRNLSLLQIPSRWQQSLMARYLHVPARLSRDALIHHMVNNDMPPNKDVFPLVSIGGYMQVRVDIAVPGDMTATASQSPKQFPTNATFSSVRETLRTGRSHEYVPISLIQDYNEETNVITALICHADGKKPASVCSRPAIRGILKHVK